VHGERNSGTNFLFQLLRKNNIPSYEGHQIGKLAVLWKHGVPRKATKMIADRVINIFIIRKLDDWLISMYNKPYYLYKDMVSFKHFLKASQRITTKKGGPMETYNIENKRPVNWQDEDKDIFDIRYQKIKSYIRYATNQPDVVFVRLDHIQNADNCRKFLLKLNDVFKLNVDMSKLVTGFDYNCKDPTKPKQISAYPNPIGPEERTIIERLKNDEIEEWVNILKYDIKDGNNFLDNDISNDFYENYVNQNNEIVKTDEE